MKVAAAVLVALGVVIGAAVVVQADKGVKDVGGVKVITLEARGRRVAWSPDGKTLAVVTKVEKTFLGFQYDRRGSAIRLWDVEKAKVRQTLAEDPEKGLAFQQVVFSADGKTIAATVSEEVIRPNVWQIHSVVKVWDAKTLALKKTLGAGCYLVCVALSPDGKLVAAGDPGKKTVQLWQAGTGVRKRTLNTGGAQPWSVAFSPNSKTLAVGGSQEVTLWAINTGKLRHTLKHPKHVSKVVFSPDGKMVAACGGGELVQVWGVEKAKVIASLTGHPRGHRAVAFSADSKTVAAAGPDGKVRLWDVRTGRLKETLKGHAAAVYSIAFSPDGKTLASVSQDQTLRLWPIKK
jgi:WD40 repeat protein